MTNNAYFDVPPDDTTARTIRNRMVMAVNNFDGDSLVDLFFELILHLADTLGYGEAAARTKRTVEFLLAERDNQP